MPFDVVVEKRKIKDTYKETFLNPKPLEVFDSPIKGKGVRIKQNIGRNQFIVDYLGEVISAVERDKREKQLGKNVNLYFFQLSDDVVLDAYYFGNEARFLNHS